MRPVRSQTPAIWTHSSIPSRFRQGLNRPTSKPNQALQDAIASQTIVETVVLSVSTVPLKCGGVLNIPFVVSNAEVTQMNAIFRLAV